MILLALDFETTGLDPEKDRIIEIGAVLFESGKDLRIIQVLDIVVCPDIDFELPIEIPGLDKEFIKKYGVTEPAGLCMLELPIHLCDYIIAHNAQFDKGFYEASTRRCRIHDYEKPWLDTMYDLGWLGKRSLATCIEKTTLFGNHLVMNLPHRAISDAFAVMQIVQSEGVEKMIEYSESPLIKIRANVVYENKDKAKENGFYWNPKNKQWNKKIREVFLPNEDDRYYEIEVIK